ncbi:hypothetical protein Acy02nite_86960 [Actinoplanes cyaneus]|uniref:Uncharacterized protein n=1 Tax=Actinoplanes cyaneus TaxID=52696 RepID=A0A919IRC6_9ACTN|nr:hypothetical protein [Actinoplanes cyaneus]MCW2144007.1 hypothetical protein [Actinoplanes cyaneus]GID70815.1 hypothetical protein Acy02nite_86960 [Actinoplanes cyaneus]
MSLTGIPLIVVAVLVTVATAALTVVTWRRGGRLRIVLRSGGVLLTETLLLLTVGLVVNRSEQFYPSWAALSSSAQTGGTTYAITPGRLDGWLRAHGPAFTWQPDGWTGWHLGAAPTVVVPAGYLDHPGWRYSALVVVDDGTTGWTPAVQTAAARDASADGGAVVVFARTTASTGVNDLAHALPAALTHDLRVTGQRWALIPGPALAALARRVAAAAPGRYTAVAAGPQLLATHRGDLGAALLWACQQTPPPLAASTPSVTSLPVPPPKHHHRPVPGASAPVPAPPRTGGTNVPGQPGH